MDPSKLSPVGQANLKGVLAGQEVYRAFPETAKGGMQTNTALLMKILEDNKDTEYGRRYGFAGIDSVEEYQKRVPLTTYADYKEYIYRMTEDGEENLLTAYPIIHYSKTSGTTGAPKRIPFTEELAKVHAKYGIAYQDGALAENIGFDWVDGKKISLLEAGITTLKCGVSYGAFSGKTILEARDSLGYLFTSPVEAMIPHDATDIRYLYVRFALMEENVTGLFCTAYSFVVEFMRYIEKNWPMVVKDIACGTIDASIGMTSEVRQELLQKIQPMPERAAKLSAIFQEGFAEPIAPKLWPRLQYIVGIGTGGFEVHAKVLAHQYMGPQVAQYRVGWFASEGHFSVPLKVNSNESVLLPDSMFYEFLPLDGEGTDKCLTMEQVEVGQSYELVMTNLAGLYRYRMQEVVKVVGWYYNTPLIEYKHRLNQTISLMGEKTTETAMATATALTAQKLAFELVDFSAYGDVEQEPFCYQVFMEIGACPEGLTLAAIRDELERNMAKENPSLGDKIARGIIGPARLRLVPEGTYLAYSNMRVAEGAVAMQMKPPHVLMNAKQIDFFTEAAQRVAGHDTI